MGIASVNSPQLNLNAQKTDGFDLEFDYRFPLAKFGIPGTLNERVLGIYTRNAKTIASGVETNAVDGATTPRFYMTALTTYSLNRLTVNLTARYTSPIKFSTNDIGPDDPSYNLSLAGSINQNLWYVPIYYNAAVAWDVVKSPGKKLQLYLNVDNLFDQNPPVVAWSLSGGPYDLVGRSYKLGVRLKY